MPLRASTLIMSLSLVLTRLPVLATIRPRLAAAAPAAVTSVRRMSGNEIGRGAGKGGGAGGSIREAGGSMGKMQAAREEEYFRRLEREQLAGMQKRLAEEIDHHEKEIAHHLEAIRKHKASMGKLGGEGGGPHQHTKDCHQKGEKR